MIKGIGRFVFYFIVNESRWKARELAFAAKPLHRNMDRQGSLNSLVGSQRQSSGGNLSSSQHTSEEQRERECICGRGLACSGMTRAFRVLRDPRQGFAELPGFRKEGVRLRVNPNPKDPSVYKYIFRNNLRAAYLRHLAKQNPDMEKIDFECPQRQFVALHHFHPEVVRAFHENPLTTAQNLKVPISITEHELKDLNIEYEEEDRILSITGVPTGGYYFVPNYSHEKALHDLKTALWAENIESKEVLLDENPEEVAVVVQSSLPSTIDDYSQSSSDDSFMTADEGQHSAPNKDGKIVRDEDSKPKLDRGGPIEDHQNGSDIPDEVSGTEKAIAHASDLDGNDPDFAIPVADSTESDFDDVLEKEKGPPQDATPEYTKQTLQQSLTGISDTISESGEAGEEEVAKGMSGEALAVKTTARLVREAGHPWDIPKYRKKTSRPEPKKPPTPAHFIDPTKTTFETTTSEHPPNATESESATPKSNVADDDQPQEPDTAENTYSQMVTELPNEILTPSTPSLTVIVEDSVASSIEDTVGTPDLSSSQPGVLSSEPLGKSIQQIKTRTSFPPLRPQKNTHQRINSFDESEVAASGDAKVSEEAIQLNHQLPGADPTLRTQVHNDLLGWESRRRSDLSNDLEFNRAKWKAAREILRDGLEEVERVKRMVLGFAKAGYVFADALQAMYDDKLLDDAGNTVTTSFFQNRLAKQRTGVEYSIENASATLASSDAGGTSSLLNSIIESQRALAKMFRDSSKYMEEEIFLEMSEISTEIQTRARKLISLGDNMLAELKRSEIEVTNIWGEFERILT